MRFLDCSLCVARFARSVRLLRWCVRCLASSHATAWRRENHTAMVLFSGLIRRWIKCGSNSCLRSTHLDGTLSFLVSPESAWRTDTDAFIPIEIVHFYIFIGRLGRHKLSTLSTCRPFIKNWHRVFRFVSRARLRWNYVRFGKRESYVDQKTNTNDG